MERPPAPPEAVLIRLAREAAGIRVAEASKRAGVSVARWSQIESGSEIRHGTVSPVTGRAGTIARMAAEVGVSPERLETKGRRPDAAEILREINRQQEERTAPRPVPVMEFTEEDLPDKEYSPEELVVLQDFAAEFKLKVMRARRRHPGERLTGQMVFPRDALYQRMWDALSELGWPLESLPRAMAAAMVDRPRESGESGTAAGLGARPAVWAIR